MEILSHPIITHGIALIIGASLGSITTQWLLRGNKKMSLGYKMFWITVLHVVVVTTYIASIIHSQFFEGNAPSIMFSALAAFSFTSLVGERAQLVEFIKAIRK